MIPEIFIPKLGLRFSFQGGDFEVTFVTNDNIRYSAIKGGKIFHIKIDDFYKKYSVGIIKCEKPAEQFLSKAISNQLMRKQYYVKSVISIARFTSSHKEVKKVITKVAEEINDNSPPSSRTVIRWTKQYLQSNSNLLSLHKTHSGNKFLRFSPEIELLISNTIAEVYLNTKEYRTSSDVLACILGKMLENNISCTPPSLRTIQRRIEKLDPYLITKAREGSRLANQKFKASGSKMSSPFLMAIVEIDTHLLDLIIIDAQTKEVIGRPYLSCAIDVYSRSIVAFYISMLPPSTSSTLALLKEMLTRVHQGLPGGMPSLIIPDNGVEFKNSTFSRVCNELGITIQPSQNRTPDNKPHIERFFETLTFGFIQKLKGTTFSNPKDRGEYDSKKYATTTMENLESYINQWIHEIYHKSIHSGIQRAPIIVWEESIKLCPPIKLPLTQIDIITRRAITRTIHSGQIKYSNLTYKSHALTTLEALGYINVTVLIDESDLSYINIEHPKEIGTYIQADSTTPNYTKNLTMHEHLLIRKKIKELSRSDLEKLGEYTADYARWKLYEQIQSDSKFKKRKSKQLKIDLPDRYRDLLDDQLIFNNEIKKLESVDNTQVLSANTVQLVRVNDNTNLSIISKFKTLEFDDE
ncbi:TPA: transposase [Acinetobacter baumannii]|nr:transposase [Acinetobacter baumannii]